MFWGEPGGIRLERPIRRVGWFRIGRKGVAAEFNGVKLAAEGARSADKFWHGESGGIPAGNFGSELFVE